MNKIIMSVLLVFGLYGCSQKVTTVDMPRIDTKGLEVDEPIEIEYEIIEE